MSKNILTTIIPENPEELAYKEMYGRALTFLAGWLPHVPQSTDTWRGIGSFTIQPPPSDLDGLERNREKMHWVADITNQVIAVGGRIISIGWWGDGQRTPPTITIRLGVGTIVTRHRSPDLFDLYLEHSILVVDLDSAANDEDDPLAQLLIEHLIDAEDRIGFNWQELVAKSIDFVPDNE